jgi:hypothetical protein
MVHGELDAIYLQLAPHHLPQPLGVEGVKGVEGVEGVEGVGDTGASSSHHTSSRSAWGWRVWGIEWGGF